MSVKRFIYVISFVFSLLAYHIGAEEQQVMFSSVEVQVNDTSYSLEYAQTHKQRAQGLMHRNSMCESCGMLFNFQQARGVSMWMKDTHIPLDVAFIRADGFIVNVETMKPLELSTTSSSGKVLYAWEMNKGWFAKNGIGVGDTVLVSDK
ncbi:DUF192 domain-containing protein [Paraglaciecola sp.]|uniref:DUF192 domain-containing protein n=1 Tax=Paraglaciecola sp. TaxID=1920173 RepID=UPI003EF90CF0